MRRLVSVFSLGTLSIVLAVVFATQVASFEATPGATPEAGVVAMGLAQVDLPPPPVVAEGTPAPTYLLRLKRVEVAPDTMPSQHHHNGAFALSVEEGAICYTLVTNDHGTVTAALSQDVAPPPGCESSIDCVDFVCTLDAGDTIYLPTGSTLTQTHGETHFYGNVDPAIPAVVYLAEYQSHQDAAPCSGGCH